jgi:hypothetical protein
MGQMQNEQMVVVVQMKKFQKTDKGPRNEKFFFQGTLKVLASYKDVITNEVFQKL